MVAVVRGTRLGLQRTSGFMLGGSAQLGGAGLGHDGGGVWVNAATGNLVLSRQDEVLVVTGSDVLASRTYNSLGSLNDDNGDNWRMGLTRREVQTSGTYGAAGSTVTRIDWDGSELVYGWDAERSAYVSKEGAGAFDILTLSGNTWTDGDSRVQELCDSASSGRITAQKDANGNHAQLRGLVTHIHSCINTNGHPPRLERSSRLRANQEGGYINYAVSPRWPGAHNQRWFQNPPPPTALAKSPSYGIVRDTKARA